MPATVITGHSLRMFGMAAISAAVLFLQVILVPTEVHASPSNRLQRLEIRPKNNYTRVTVKLLKEPKFEVLSLPGNRVRIRLEDTEGPIFKRFRGYSDRNMGGVVTKRRGKDLLLTFAIASKGVGWRIVHLDGVQALSVDVGPLFEQKVPRPILSGRERIWSGAEKLLRDFDPPIKPEVPFSPTDRQVLKGLVSEDDQKLFLAAESALYKGRLTAAEDVFAQFVQRKTPIRALALYRLGETQYRLQKYPQALASFKEAEQLWAEFLTFNPTAMFYYGDSIARSGDLGGGRQLLARLIAAHADKKYAPALLVRMADVIARQGNEAVAAAIYRTVADNFPDNKAHQIARMKLADRRFLYTTPLDYKPLSELYKEISERAGDYDLREEASFKRVLLESINGPAESALEQVTQFQKRFPKGVYVAITRDVREDLVDITFRSGGWDKNPEGLVSLVKGNQDFLAVVASAPDFFPQVTNAYEKAARPLDLIELYSGLLDRPWIGDNNAPYLYMQIADNAEMLGDSLMAKKMLKTMVSKYPSYPQIRPALEHLGALHYSDKELGDVKTRLSWILNKNEKASRPESYYYLGKSLWAEKQYIQSAQSLELYLASVKTAKPPVLLSDAYYTAAMARAAAGDRKTAIQLLDDGLKVIPAERSDQFLYKLGELSVAEGRLQQARTYFDKVVQSGKDPDWRKMSAQALENIPPDSKSKKQ